jgi:hypothetical protein
MQAGFARNARNRAAIVPIKGHSMRPFKIVAGDALALTPPMGWNDWYTHYDRIDEKAIRGAADAMIASGMADFGYAYVNIDGCWTMKPGSPDPMLSGEARDGSGTLRPNGHFGDMQDQHIDQDVVLSRQQAQNVAKAAQRDRPVRDERFPIMRADQRPCVAVSSLQTKNVVTHAVSHYAKLLRGF